MTYAIADEYLSQSMGAGKMATNTFIGPDLMWVDVWKESDLEAGQVKGQFTKDVLKTNYLDDGDIEDYENDDQADAIRALPVPLDCDRVEINCDTHPHICAMFIGGNSVGDETGSYDNLPQVDFTLPGESEVYYSRTADENTPPDHVYDREDSIYHIETGEWELKLVQPWASWDNLRKDRNEALANSDFSEAMPDNVPEKADWMTYRQALRDVTKYEAAGAGAHMAVFPRSPQETRDSEG